MSTPLKLSTRIVITGAYEGISKFKFWENLRIGHIITLSIALESPGYGRGLYATTVRFLNETTGETTADSLTEASKRLDKLTYEVL